MSGNVAPMPVIVGAPRSGTTLLRLMLDAHPEMAVGPETAFLPPVAALAQRGLDSDALRAAFRQVVTAWPEHSPTWVDFGLDAQALREQLLAIEPFDVGDGLRAFYRLYAARFGKARWGDKTPSYSGHLVAIHAMLPEARFIHLIRDGRGVAESWRRMWFAPGKDMDTLAAAWQGCIREARRQSTLVPHYLELRYESLVRDPRGALEEVCASSISASANACSTITMAPPTGCASIRAGLRWTAPSC